MDKLDDVYADNVVDGKDTVIAGVLDALTAKYADGNRSRRLSHRQLGEGTACPVNALAGGEVVEEISVLKAQVAAVDRSRSR
ncbi:MAG: hypothetical protein U0470_05530 [Anaerolineae bacterium]